MTPMPTRRMFLGSAIAAAVQMSPTLSAAGAGAPRSLGFYIEFMARPNEYLVGHAYVQIGRLTASGSSRSTKTVAYFPYDYPDLDIPASVLNARGKFQQRADDTSETASVRFRVRVDARTYHAALTHAGRLGREWRDYDIATRNCNHVIFEFASRLDLAVGRNTLDLPENVVRDLAARNAGRATARWSDGGVRASDRRR